MKLSMITIFLLIFGSYTSPSFGQHRGGVATPHHQSGYSGGYYHGAARFPSYDRGTNFYNHNYRPGIYGNRPGYAYNPYFGLGVVNPLYLNNLSYPIYGGYPSYSNLPLGSNALATCNYPYGSQQYRWCFFRQYGFFPY